MNEKEPKRYVFEVDGDGTLRPKGFVDPVTRADYHDGALDGWHASPKALADRMEEHEPLQWSLTELYEEIRNELADDVSSAEGALEDAEAELAEKEELVADPEGRALVARLRERLAASERALASMHEDPAIGLIEWVRTLSPEFFAQKVVPLVEAWFEEPPEFGTSEEDKLPSHSTGQDEAFWFFAEGDGSEHARKLGVRVIDGDRPGSNYRGAELRVPVEEANRRAEQLGVSIRFVDAEGEA